MAIKIKESRKGTFTAAAKKRGKSMDDKREISLKSSDRLKQERNELHGYFL